jgi:hypothetical protein
MMISLWYAQFRSNPHGEGPPPCSLYDLGHLHKLFANFKLRIATEIVNGYLRIKSKNNK